MLKVGDLIEIPGLGNFYVPVTEISIVVSRKARNELIILKL